MNFVPQNSFSSLVVHGLVKLNDGSAASLHLPSVNPGPAPQTEFIHKPFKTPKGHQCPPSSLPPPGHLTLEIKIGEQLGYGRVGRVYSIDVLSPSDANLPPLVAKVSIPGYSHSVAREAWFYEEMESLQGISIARCYGLFQTQLGGEFTLLSDDYGERMKRRSDEKWLMNREPEDVPYTHKELAPLHYTIYRVPYTRRLQDIDETVDQDQVQVDIPQWRDLGPLTVSQKKEAAKYWPVMPINLMSFEEDGPSMPKSKTPAEENLYTETDPTVMSIIILERLGGYIPMKTKLDTIRPDVIDVFHDMALLGVRQQDIRWRNILRVPQDSLKTRLPCPTHGRVHGWCPVDFDLALKTQFRVINIDSSNLESLSTVLNGLMFGKVIEPFDSDAF